VRRGFGRFARRVTSPDARAALKAWVFVGAAFWRALSIRPQVIVATLPTALLAGWLAAWLLKARMVYYPFELYAERHVREPRFWLAAETLILRRGVDAVITQNSQRASVYRLERHARVEPTIVHNYQPAAEVTSTGGLRRLLGLPEGNRLVLYEGHLIRGRWLEHLVNSIRHLPSDITLVFLGRPTPWWRHAIEPLLASPEIAGRVSVGGWIDPKELVGYIAEADAGVIIYDDLVRNNYFCEPGKLSDYVLAGVPVVAPDFPSLGPLLREYQIGCTFTGADPHAIADAIVEALAVPRPMWAERMQRARHDLVWETQLPALLTAVTGPDGH
jgi:glycosyltransferase involved in cell wall biosynthesis